MADKTATEPAADAVATSTTTGTEPLTKEELDAFGGDWSEGEHVDEKEAPAGASGDEDEATDTDDSEEADAGEEESTDKDSEEAEKPADDKEETTETEKTDETSEEKSTLSPEEQKAHNDEMAKARIAERDARVAAQKAQKDAQEATIKRYLDEAGDDELELERRQLNVEAFRLQEDKIELNQERLQTGIERAVANIELFRTGTPAVQEELAKSLDDFERQYVVKDDKGRPVEVKGDVVQFLQAKAESILRIQQDGASQQGKDKSKQQSRTVTPPVRAPKKAKADPQMEGFKEEAARY